MAQAHEIAGDAAPSEDPKPLAEIQRLARLSATGVIPDAIRRLKRAAPGIGAGGFSVFFTGRGTDATRLMHCFDENFPARSKVTVRLTAGGAEPIVRHAATSSLPAAWGMAGGHPFLARLPGLIEDEMGLVLPVSADPGHTGVFVFTGIDLAATATELEDLHRLCFDVFAAVAQLKSSSLTSAVSISKRELECLVLTAAGRTSEDMGRILGLSVHTANQYLTSAASKLDAVNRTQAVAKAIRLGLIE